jgi:hypothetical protein
MEDEDQLACSLTALLLLMTGADWTKSTRLLWFWIKGTESLRQEVSEGEWNSLGKRIGNCSRVHAPLNIPPLQFSSGRSGTYVREGLRRGP